MKKVKNRANSVFLIVCLLLVGISLYLVRLADSGRDWAMFRGNQSIYTSGVLTAGSVYDRNGVLLASAGGDIFRYAESEKHRRACLHTVGDYQGMIGTGVLNALSDKLIGYSFVNGTYSPTHGGNRLTLTLDAQICATAYDALSGRKGAVLVMDCDSGEIICMVSSPGYDPNNPPDLSANNPQYEGAYINRCISSTYTPGSVFKIVTLAAALDIIRPSSGTYNCIGYIDIAGKRVNCSGVHGSQTLKQSFANSCNVAFAELSLELGADVLEKYAIDLGLTSAHNISGIETAAGSITKAASGSAELAWMGIGQHEDLVSPFALLRLCAAIANGGLVTEPTIIKQSRLLNLGEKTRLLSEDTAALIQDYMLNNVSTSYGSWNFPDLPLGAKTGTAEVGNGAPHSWFAGFVKDSTQSYVFVVLVENGGSGLGAASAVANTVMQSVY